MTEKQIYCGENTGHDWQDTAKPKRYLAGIDPEVRIPVKCYNCKLKAFETYVLAAVVTQDNKRV